MPDPREQIGAEVTYQWQRVTFRCEKCGHTEERTVPEGSKVRGKLCRTCQLKTVERAGNIQKKAGRDMLVTELREDMRPNKKYHIHE